MEREVVGLGVAHSMAIARETVKQGVMLAPAHTAVLVEALERAGWPKDPRAGASGGEDGGDGVANRSGQEHTKDGPSRHGRKLSGSDGEPIVTVVFDPKQ
jgi:hypothetical protein